MIVYTTMSNRYKEPYYLSLLRLCAEEVTSDYPSCYKWWTGVMEVPMQCIKPGMKALLIAPHPLFSGLPRRIVSKKVMVAYLHNSKTSFYAGDTTIILPYAILGRIIPASMRMLASDDVNAIEDYVSYNASCKKEAAL